MVVGGGGAGASAGAAAGASAGVAAGVAAGADAEAVAGHPWLYQPCARLAPNGVLEHRHKNDPLSVHKPMTRRRICSFLH